MVKIGYSLQGSGGGGDDVAKLDILEGSFLVNEQSTQHFEIPIKFTKYELKSLRINNLTNLNPITLKMGEINDVNVAQYISVNKNKIEDIVSLPMFDRSNTKSIHVWITNNFPEGVNIGYDVRITNLR